MASQGTTYPYCDVGDDLRMAYKDIDDFNGVETLTDWTVVTGNAQTFSKENSGFFGIVWQGGVTLVEKTSIATVQATASTWWYDSTNDVLYVHCSDGADPDTHTMTAGIDDWKTLKETMRNNAMETVESLLDPSYNRPLPFAKNSYNSAKYDFDIVYATALLTCYLLIKMRDPENPIADRMYREVWNPETGFGILYEHTKGSRKFSFEATKDDFDGRLENITLDATSTGRIYLSGNGDSVQHKKYRVKIDKAGAVETATYSLSDDNGLSLYATSQSTYYEPQYLAHNVWIRFDGTFVLADEWLVEFAGTDEVVQSNLFSVKLLRK